MRALVEAADTLFIASGHRGAHDDAAFGMDASHRGGTPGFVRVESDTRLALNLQEGRNYSIYRCRNGMTDCASPIIIDGRHVANVFVGQFHLPTIA